MARARPRVVIIGAGFGGLQCARKLSNEPVDVVLVDRRNYHLFTPLLYQVASCLLSPADIAAPLRKVFRGARNVRFLMGDVARIDFEAKVVHLADGAALPYDHVVLAAGSRTNFFGNDDLAAVRARAQGSRRSAPVAQPRARLPRTARRRPTTPTSGAGC